MIIRGIWYIIRFKIKGSQDHQHGSDGPRVVHIDYGDTYIRSAAWIANYNLVVCRYEIGFWLRCLTCFGAELTPDVSAEQMSQCDFKQHILVRTVSTHAFSHGVKFCQKVLETANILSISTKQVEDFSGCGQLLIFVCLFLESSYFIPKYSPLIALHQESGPSGRSCT